MKSALNIFNFTFFGLLIALFLLMAFSIPELGLPLAVCAVFMMIAVYSMINFTEAERVQMRKDAAIKRKEMGAKKDAGGVHWFWWVFWLIMFFPALIVVAIVHSGRKNRAVIRELKLDTEQNLNRFYEPHGSSVPPAA